MNLDELNKKIKNDFDIYDKLKKIFSKIQTAEAKTSKERIEYFENLFQIKEYDNEGLKLINDKFREGMKKLEEERDIHLKTILELLIPVTEMYPIELKRQKKNMEDLARTRKIMGAPPGVNNPNRAKYELDFEKEYSKFLSNKTKDNKYIFMHYIFSELKYHSASLEKLTNLFFEINNIEPIAHLRQFGTQYGIGKINFDRLKINIEEIEAKEKKKKEKENEEKDDVFNENEEEEVENEETIDKKKKSGIKNSSIKKSKKKIKEIKKSENDEIKIDNEKEKENEKEKARIEDDE
jgi:hypothetical protein